MVFKFKTLDFTEDINTTFPYSLLSSPESTICLPLSHSCTCTRSIGVRVAAGVSQFFTAPRLDSALYQAQGRKKSKELPGTASGLGNDTEFPDQRQLRRFTLKELEIATDNFSKANVVGQGGFGTVYKGRLSSIGVVAVKRYRQASHQGEAEFRSEVEVGKMVMHPNVVSLIGFCEMTKAEELLLVYPFMANGCLPSHLYNRPGSQPPMHWDTRKRIVLGVARALSYLHGYCSRRIIHHDIKPSNILLDENLEPRVGDFGLARFMDHKQQVGHLAGEPFDDQSEGVTSRICGTYGYMAPEYAMKGKYSTKTDVFAFGMMLLELISSCNYVNLCQLANAGGVGPPSDWVKQLVDAGNLERVIDRSIRDDCNRIEAERLIKLSLICTQWHSPANRPDMSDVVSILEGSSNSLGTRWEEFHHNWAEVGGARTAWFNEEFCSSTTGTGFASSAFHLDPEELSGPR